MDNDDYFDDINRWRSKIENNLRSEFSWLSLTGLFWLSEGKNSLGAHPSNDIVLPANSAPDHVGEISLTNGVTEINFLGEVRDQLDEITLETKILNPDSSNDPTYLHIFDLRLLVLERDNQMAVRVWDKNNPARSNFNGREWFTVDENFRKVAVIHPYESPKIVPMSNVLGNQFEVEMVSQVAFEHDNQEILLDAMATPSGKLYLIFKDSSNNLSTYPSGRYLYSEIPEGDKTVIDFNKAYNPPCAFTDFATCTLPSPENYLTTAIEAGEKYLKHD